jgi:hypothetical protein
MDFKADLHTCGRPLSESLHLDGKPDVDYVLGESVCVACKRSNAYVEKHHKEGLPPHVVLQVYTRDEAKAIHQKQTEGR